MRFLKLDNLGKVIIILYLVNLLRMTSDDVSDKYTVIKVVLNFFCKVLNPHCITRPKFRQEPEVCMAKVCNIDRLNVSKHKKCAGAWRVRNVL